MPAYRRLLKDKNGNIIYPVTNEGPTWTRYIFTEVKPDRTIETLKTNKGREIRVYFGERGSLFAVTSGGEHIQRLKYSITQKYGSTFNTKPGVHNTDNNSVISRRKGGVFSGDTSNVDGVFTYEKSGNETLDGQTVYYGDAVVQGDRGCLFNSMTYQANRIDGLNWIIDAVWSTYPDNTSNDFSDVMSTINSGRVPGLYWRGTTSSLVVQNYCLVIEILED